MSTQVSDPVCCSKFDPVPWDGKMFPWENKKFVEHKVLTLFYMPLNFGAVMTRMSEKIEQAGATFVDGLCLSHHASMWSMSVFLAVDKEIPDAHNVTLSGNYLSKVYEGDFKNTGVWMKDFASYVQTQGHAVKQTYMWYTTCPKCAKKYGKNYVVIVGQL
jgi:hypothetical protein